MKYFFLHGPTATHTDREDVPGEPREHQVETVPLGILTMYTNHSPSLWQVLHENTSSLDPGEQQGRNIPKLLEGGLPSARLLLSSCAPWPSVH